MDNGHNPAAGHGGHHAVKTLPADLSAPAVVTTWQVRAFVVFAVFALVSLLFAFTHEGRNHLLRGYLAGWFTVFNITGGAFAFLMVQYCSGGKWGHILRRPLEAMTRTIWLLVVLFIVGIFPWMKHLYQWAQFQGKQATLDAYHAGALTLEQHLDIDMKAPMLNPWTAIAIALITFAFMGLVISLLNAWSLKRDQDPEAGTKASYDRWRTKFENLSGPSILAYVILLTAFVITFVKSLDVIWASSVYGAQFLVAQGYGALAAGIITLILLSRFEPMKTLFRVTEMHDIGKLTFAFVMLNIYLTFCEFLIIWSGNIPDELSWYNARIHGGWWVICSADVILHWVLPFCLLLSRELKRSKRRLIWVAVVMILARMTDIFWLIEPNFRDAAGNLHLADNVGILAYFTVPVAMLGLWAGVFFMELKKRPLLNLNDPHTAELLEPDHAH